MWKFLAMYPKKFIKMNIKIPETLVVLGNNNFCYLTYDPVRKGLRKRTELEININDFEKIVTNQVDKRYID